MHDHRQYDRSSVFQWRGDGICFFEGGRLVFPVILILVVLVLPGTAQVPDKTAGTITAVSGKVTIKRPGSEQALAVSEGDELLVGDELTAPADSAVQMTFADGSFLNLFPGSSCRVNQYSFDPAGRRRIARVKILTGKARFIQYQVTGSGSSFFLETATALIVPEMISDFAVSVSEAGTEVAALGRAVRVRSSSSLIIGEVRLEMNQKTIVRGNGMPQAPVTLSRAERKGYVKDIEGIRKAAAGVRSGNR